MNLGFAKYFSKWYWKDTENDYDLNNILEFLESYHFKYEIKLKHDAIIIKALRHDFHLIIEKKYDFVELNFGFLDYEQFYVFRHSSEIYIIYRMLQHEIDKRLKQFNVINDFENLKDIVEHFKLNYNYVFFNVFVSLSGNIKIDLYQKAILPTINLNIFTDGTFSIVIEEDSHDIHKTAQSYQELFKIFNNYLKVNYDRN